MTAENQLEIPPGTAPRHVTQSMLDRLVRPPRWNRVTLAGAVVLLLLIVGIADYHAGVQISLGVLYLVPVTLATTWFDRQVGIATAAGCMAARLWGDSLSQPAHHLQAWMMWNAGASLLVHLLVVWALGALLQTHRRLEQRVHERTADLEREIAARRLAQSELLSAGARERRSIGEELHDHVAQHLTATAMAAEVLAANLSRRSDPAEPAARAVVAMVGEGIDQARKVAQGLLLSEIDPGRLGSELAELCRDQSRLHPAIEFACRIEGAPHVGDSATAAQFYRIAQEALRNAARHSGASRVELKLAGDELGAVLTVQDDGRGLPPANQHREGAMGLRIMQHRAVSIGAILSITSPPGGGTRLACRRLLHQPTSDA